MTIVTPYRSNLWNNRSLASSLWQEMDQLYNERNSSTSHEVSETEDHFLLSIDLPGMKRDDLQIEVQSGVLTISGERAREPKRTFKRSFTLPESVQGDRIEARYEDGVLELYLPKAAEAQPRKIQIQTDKGGFFDKLLSSKKSQPEIKNVAGNQ